jgi:hypothetical protein
VKAHPSPINFPLGHFIPMTIKPNIIRIVYLYSIEHIFHSHRNTKPNSTSHHSLIRPHSHQFNPLPIAHHETEKPRTPMKRTRGSPKPTKRYKIIKMQAANDMTMVSSRFFLPDELNQMWTRQSPSFGAVLSSTPVVKGKGRANERKAKRSGD